MGRHDPHRTGCGDCSNATRVVCDRVSHTAIAGAVLNALTTGAILIDPDERILHWNPWLEHTSGLACRQVIGRGLFDVFPHLADSRLALAIQSALCNGLPSALSNTLNRSPFPLYTPGQTGQPEAMLQQKINVLPLANDDGPRHCLIEIFDVSAAIRRDRALQEQKSFLNAILDNEPECVLVMDATGSLLQINRAGLEMFAVGSSEELATIGLADFLVAGERSAFAEFTRRVLAGNKEVAEFHIHGKGGQTRWLEIHATPLRDPARKTTTLLAVARDITERRKAQATVRALLDAPMESALLLDRQGIVLACNAIAAARFQLQREELLGRDFFTLLPPVLAANRRQRCEQVFQTGEPETFQDERNGIHFDVSIYPVQDMAGQVASIAVYAADVTDKIRAQGIEKLFHSIDEYILRGQPIKELLSFICAQVSSIYGFPAVWIGRKQPGGSVGLKAWGGASAEFREQLQETGLRWDNTPLGHDPGGTAIRTGKPQQADVSDPCLAPWRDIASAAGLRTFLCLPLILGGEVYGSFTLSADRPNAFTQASVVQHMSDIANRICIALEKATDHQQLRLLRTALASAANGVFITDRSGHIEWVNAAFLRMSGYSEEEAIGATPNLLRSPQSRQAYFEEMWAALARGEVWSGETLERRKDGSEFTANQIITPITGPEGETSHYISILEDITEKKAAEERIRRLAHYDQLTDLPNRTLFQDRLHTTISRARRDDEHFALMFLDLDRFKQVNDTFGHDTGDLLLREVANRLRTCVRDSDSVARLAGDEFTLLLPGAHTREDAAVVAQKIIEAMTPPVDIAGHALLTSPSIGIAFYPQDGNDEPSLLRAADQAMYTAKAAGRNTFAFYQPLF